MLNNMKKVSLLWLVPLLCACSGHLRVDEEKFAIGDKMNIALAQFEEEDLYAKKRFRNPFNLAQPLFIREYKDTVTHEDEETADKYWFIFSGHTLIHHGRGDWREGMVQVFGAYADWLLKTGAISASQHAELLYQTINQAYDLPNQPWGYIIRRYYVSTSRIERQLTAGDINAEEALRQRKNLHKAVSDELDYVAWQQLEEQNFAKTLAWERPVANNEDFKQMAPQLAILQELAKPGKYKPDCIKHGYLVACPTKKSEK